MATFILTESTDDDEWINNLKPCLIDFNKSEFLDWSEERRKDFIDDRLKEKSLLWKMAVIKQLHIIIDDPRDDVQFYGSFQTKASNSYKISGSISTKRI